LRKLDSKIILQHVTCVSTVEILRNFIGTIYIQVTQYTSIQAYIFIHQNDSIKRKNTYIQKYTITKITAEIKRNKGKNNMHYMQGNMHSVHVHIRPHHSGGPPPGKREKLSCYER